MSRTRANRMVAALGVATLFFVSACSGGGSPESSASESGSAPSSRASSQETGDITWTDCGGNQCGTLQVPLDYDNPDAGEIKIAMVRIPATDQDNKIGSLLVNPGGPGGSGIEFAQGFSLPPEVSSRMDVIGFDPRGVGQSSPINCHSHLEEMYDADPTMEDRADRTRYLAISKEYVDECADKAGKVLPFLGTTNVARDMDQIRQALGEEKLNYLGYSYGTSIGQMYAQLFPTKIRAMVLDGVVNTEQTGLAAADGQAAAFEDALDTYLADCAANSCELGANPKQVVRSVIARAERAPIPAPRADRPATPGVVQLGIGQALYSKSLWPQLTQALLSANRGDGSGLVELANQYLGRNPDGSYPNSFDIYFAVSCLDSEWPDNPSAVFANAKKVAKQAPLMGEGLVNDYVRCAMWPGDPKPLPKVTAEGSPPIVVVSTTRDPATPYQSGVDVAKRLPQGVLISYDGDGHTIYGQGNPCVDDAVDTYLVDAKAPADGLECG